MSGRPPDVLKTPLDEPATVLLRDRNAYLGVLAGYDRHMNVVLEEALGEDIVPGDIELEQVQDTAIIRGDNVIAIKA